MSLSLRWLLLSWLCFFGCAARAEETVQQVVDRLRAAQLVAGKFEQRQQLQGLDYPLQSAGEFIFWQGHGLYLAHRQPFFNASTFALDKILHWQEDGASAPTEEQNNLLQREISRTLLAFFNADMKLLEERFTTQWAFATEGWALTLVPRHEQVRKQMQQVVIRGDRYIQTLQLQAGNGDRTDLSLSAIVEAPAPNRAQCRWFYPPDARAPCETLPPAAP